MCTGHWCPKNNCNYKSLLKNVRNIFLKLADINNFYHKLWIILKIWILNLRSYCLFLDTPKIELKGIYGKHTARSFENIILLITEIKYFTSFYLKLWIMLKIWILNLRSYCLFLDTLTELKGIMFIGAAYWLFNSLIFYVLTTNICIFRTIIWFHANKKYFEAYQRTS